MTRKQQFAIHERWRTRIPTLHGADKERYENGQQCLHCRYYVPLEGPLGADWGVCTKALNVNDGELVFEHHTCRDWKRGAS